MKSKLDELSQRYLILFKLDATRLFERIKHRKPQYLEIFALKRTREHYRDIFFSRYTQATIQELAQCGQDIIAALDDYYGRVEALNWYLNHTEDMPVTIDEKLEREIKKMEQLLSKLRLYIDAELGIIKEANNISDIPTPPID
ncbi:MAG: hypothetical protein JNM93_05430 [Bacteriovoracaceae bacterium]|nr:hypothetical protein [Bacteriovoracaceae bacterium]